MTRHQEGAMMGMGERPVSAARVTQRVDGSGKGNTNTFLPMPWRPPVTGTDGSWGILSIPGMSHGKRKIFMLYFVVLKIEERYCLKWQHLSSDEILILVKIL